MYLIFMDRLAREDITPTRAILSSGSSLAVTTPGGPDGVR